MRLDRRSRRTLPAGLALATGLALLAPAALVASEPAAISGFVDDRGRVVFVNEAPVNPEDAAKSTRSTSKESPGRKVIAKASGLAKSAESPANFASDMASASAPSQTESSGSAAESGGAPNTREGIREGIRDLVDEAAERHQVDADLIHAIVRVESNYNPFAVSHKGARGLMQLIPATARRFGVSNSFDPRDNLDGGIRYLKYLMGLFKGDLRLSLAAYNAGEMAVTRNGGVPPYRETQDYVRKITALYPMRTVAAAAGVPVEPRIVRYVDDSGVVHFSNTEF